MASVLLVSKDAVVCQLVGQVIDHLGHELLIASNAEEAIHAGVTISLDAAVLDESVIPTGVLASVSHWMRGRVPTVPIILLAARSGSVPELGDAVIEQPFVAEVLRIALQVALRPGSHVPLKMRAGVVELDRRRLDVTLGEVRVDLTPTQFRVIACLADSQGEIVSTTQLIAYVWGDRRPDATTDLLRSNVYTLRARLRKLTDDELIQNVPYRGYRLAS